MLRKILTKNHEMKMNEKNIYHILTLPDISNNNNKENDRTDKESKEFEVVFIKETLNID